MVPDFQTLMRPVLELAARGETKISDAVEELSDVFELTETERGELLPSGKQTKMANRVHWARTYLKQAGLLKSPRRGFFEITDAGKEVLATSTEEINSKFLQRFAEFQEFQNRSSPTSEPTDDIQPSASETTPDEVLRSAHTKITAALADDLLDRLRESEPKFFEDVIVRLLLAMGYGYGSGSGEVIGMAGDDGVDGVINLDRLGVDQVYIQAKRYGAQNSIGSGAIRDFYGALGMKDVTKGIFVTTSSFSPSAKQTAEKLGARIVLVDGMQLAHLMIAHEIGCRVTETFKIATLEESFFE